MYYRRLDTLIYILVGLVPVGFMTTYVIALMNGHVEAFLPYISDTGTEPPESCIFAQILALGAFIQILIAFIRYHHVKLIIQFVGISSLPTVNILGFCIGIVSSIGVTIVGSFQETNVVTMHFFGAGLAYGGLFFFSLIQTYLSYKLREFLKSDRKFLLARVILLIISFTLSMMFSIFSSISRSKFDGDNPRKWLPSDGGYLEHIVSTASEWILTFCLMGLLVSFSFDFRLIKVAYPSVHDPNLEKFNSSGIRNSNYETFNE
ncbi:DNA damage-regulated autophagy modulator [Brachionus plicatilis]|uniref:DNA damage-regulated autophagy modulator n=1 Tax=Brachionus plicatilis TaxID=10195 RepID=A0A3M7S7E0_BRAPC|nr:DNA damage-regulated autophagy modulator [Brachionus plicatilis]